MLLAQMVVQYLADTSKLISGVQEAAKSQKLMQEATLSATSAMSSGFKSASSDIQALTVKAEGAQSGLAGMADRLQNAGGRLLDFGSKLGMTIFGVQNLIQGAMGLGQALIGSNASMEQTQIAFTQLFGSAKIAGDYLNQLQAFAASTPFNFPELATDAQQMMAFGFSAQDVIPMLQDIGDAMSAMGKGQDAVAQIVMVFGQMHAAGKLNAQDMMQLTSVGIPGWKMLADSMHLSVAEVQKMTTDGLIPADKAISILREGMHSTFGGAMQAQSQTFNGLLSTLQDNAGMALRAFTGPLFEQAKSGLTQLGNLVSAPAFQQFATDMGQKVGVAIQNVANFIQSQAIPAFERFSGFISANIIPAVKTAATWFDSFVGHGQALTPVLAGLGAIIAAVLIPAMASLAAEVVIATWPFLAIGLAVAGLVAIFMHFYNTFAPFKSFVDNTVKSITNWINSGQVWRDIMAAIQPIIAYLSPLIANLGAAVSNLGKTLSPLIANLGLILMHFGQWFASSGILNGIIAGLVVGVGLFVQGLTLLVNVLNNVIVFFSTGGSNAKGLWNILSQIGAFIVAQFAPVWQQLVTLWQSQIVPILQMLGTAFASLLPYIVMLKPVLQALGILLGISLAVSIAAIIGLITGLAKGLATFISGLITFISGFIQYFTGMFQVVSGIVQLIADLLTGKFGKVQADLALIWLGVQNMFMGAWKMIVGLFQMSIGTIIGFVQGFVTGIVNFFVSLYHSLVGGSIVPDMINGIVDFFGQLPGRVGAWVQQLVSNVFGYFTDMANQSKNKAIDLVNWVVNELSKLIGRAESELIKVKDKILGVLGNAATDAFNAGAHIVSQIASGITGSIQKVKDAIGGVAQWISDHLPHSPAKVGPLRDLNYQGSQIVGQVSVGMMAGLPQLETAIGRVTKPVALALGTSGTRVQPSSSQSSSNRQQTAIPQQQDVYLIIDGRKFAKATIVHIGPELAKEVRAVLK